MWSPSAPLSASVRPALLLTTRSSTPRNHLSIGAKRKATRKRAKGQPSPTPALIHLWGPRSVLRPSPIRTVPSAPELHRILRISERLVCLGTTAFPDSFVRSLQISPRGLYRRSGIGKFPSLTLPRRSYLFSSREYIAREAAGSQGGQTGRVRDTKVRGAGGCGSSRTGRCRNWI